VCNVLKITLDRVNASLPTKALPVHNLFSDRFSLFALIDCTVILVILTLVSLVGDFFGSVRSTATRAPIIVRQTFVHIVIGTSRDIVFFDAKS